MTAKHYAQPEAVSTARTARFEQVLGLDKAPVLEHFSAEQLLAALPPDLRDSLIAMLTQQNPPVPQAA